MKVTVCELRNDDVMLEQDWKGLMEHLLAEKSDLLLLPEMPFYKWLAGTKKVEVDKWQAAVDAHDNWIQKFQDVHAPTIIGTRPVLKYGQRYNEGFVWTKTAGYRAVHHKYYLPNEKGFWEANWYQRGEREFNVKNLKGVKIGFLICTELWFNVHAREYSKQGIHLLVCPRVTPLSSVDKWIAGGRTAATVAGAFCLSSNLSGPNVEGIDFGGSGWIIEPENGDLLATTSQAKPFITLDINLNVAEKAKETYPRYVLD
jgi:N-carbamoylputrescine amidase